MNYTKQVLVGLTALLVLATLMGAASAATLTFGGAELPDSYEVIDTDANGNETINVTTTDQSAYFNLTTETNGTTTTVYVNGIVPYYADTSVFDVRTPTNESVDAQPYAFVAKIFVNNATEESIVEARAKENGTLEIFPMLVDNKGHAYFYYVGFANVDANDSNAWDETITIPFLYIFENQSEMEKNASNPALIVDFKLNATPEKVPGLIDVRNEWLSVETTTDEETGEESTATTSPVFDEGKLGENLKNVSQPLGINYQLDENATDEEGNPLDNVYTVYVTGTIPFYSQDPTSLEFAWDNKNLTNLAVLQILVRNAAEGATLTVEDDDLAEVKLVSDSAFAGTIEPDFDYIFAAFAFPNDEDALDPEEYPRTVTFTADGADGTLTLNFDFSGCTFATAPTPVLRKATVDFYRPGWGNQDGLYLEEPNFGFEAVEISEDEMDYVIVLDGTIPYSADDYTGLWNEYNEIDTDGENYKNMFTIKLYIDGAVDNVFGDRLNVLSAAEIESSSAGQTYALSEVMDGYGRDDVRLLYLVGYMAEDENGTVNFWNNTTYSGVVSGNETVPANRWTIDNGYGKTMNIYVINKADLETVSDITFVLFGNSKASSFLNKTYAPDANASEEPEGTPEAAVLVYDREANLVGAQWADEGMATFTLPDGDYTYVVRFNRGLYEEEYGMVGSAADFDEVSEWVYKSESFNTADATEGQIAVNLESTVRFFNAYGQAIDPTYKVVDLISGEDYEIDDADNKTYDTVALNNTAIDIYDASGRILIATREMGDNDYWYNGIDVGSLTINLADGNYMYRMYTAMPGEYVITSDGAIAQALVYPNAPRIGYIPTDLIPFTVTRDELQIKQINSTLKLGFENYFYVYDRSAANFETLSGQAAGDRIAGIGAIIYSGIAGANITITDGNKTYVATPKYLADDTSESEIIPQSSMVPEEYVVKGRMSDNSECTPIIGLYSAYLPFGEYTFTVEADGYGYGRKSGSLTVDEDALLQLFPSGTSAADVFARVIGMTANDMGFGVYNSGDRALDDATVMIWTSDLDKNLDAPIATDLTGVANAGSHGWSEFGTVTMDIRELHEMYTIITAQPNSLYFNKYVNGSDYEAAVDDVVMTLIEEYGVPEDVAESVGAYAVYEPLNQSQLPVGDLPFDTFQEFVYWIDFYAGLYWSSETAEGTTPIIGEYYLPNDDCLLWHVEKDNSSRDEDDELYTDVYPFVSNGQNRVVVPLTQTYKVTICVWEETVLGDLPINTATFQNLDKVSKTPSVQKGN